MSVHRTHRTHRACRHRKRPFLSTPLSAVVANEKGEIFDVEGFSAVGADGPCLTPLTASNTIVLPHGSELMFLPDRVPVLMEQSTGKIRPVFHHPDFRRQRIFPVAAFNSPGVVLTHTSAHEADKNAPPLPLFAYGAVGWCENRFRCAALVVDAEPRQDLRQMPQDKVIAGVEAMRRELPDNRLARHLEHCALTYGCPAGKNFFLGRYEAPLPTSRACNARCLGCISLQKNPSLVSSQNRIVFTPSPREIAEVAFSHIRRVKKSVVSFGQGCEGDPLMAARVIEPAIIRIRKKTSAGTINLNTNASLPRVLEPLLDAGLDSIRVSLNSVREPLYQAYFRPRGYKFSQVLESIDLALSKGIHVALNYLNCPGVTDAPEEAEALFRFLEKHPVHLIQWRNLNFDPRLYYDLMAASAPLGSPIGMAALIKTVRERFPLLRHGYFNPPREHFPGTLRPLTIKP